MLFFVHSAVLLLFGVYLSVSFAGTVFGRRTHFWCLGIAVFSGALQLVVYVLLGETAVWNLYPVITHLPLLCMMVFALRKRWIASICSICTAYLFCQPAKWFGVLVRSLSGSETAEYLVRICVLAVTAGLILHYAASCLAEIFDKTTKNVLIFGITPAVYYVFDYISGVYTDFWQRHDRVTLEFLPFFLSIIFLVFCVVYYREYECKADVERKEQIIRLTVEEQAKELKAMERSNLEVRILRHDLRLFLNNLSVCIENGDLENARRLVSGYADSVDAAAVIHYCANATLNYVLSSFHERCRAQNVDLRCRIELEELRCDELLLSTILSNALDNALNAQAELPEAQRYISLMLKTSGGKLLLSVKNPCANKPVVQDGVPVASQEGHGCGTKSIVYLTQKLGGNCQFLFQNGLFVLRVII